MQSSQLAHAQYDDEISLLDIWIILREEWLLLAITIVTGLIIAFIAATVMTPIYRAEATIAQVKSAGARESVASSLLGQFGGLANLAGMNLGGNQSDGRTIIQSRTFIEEFVKEQDLMPLIYAESWDAAKNDWIDTVERAPATWQAASTFINDVYSFEEDNETGLLKLAIEWKDPELAASWANRLVALANETARMRDIADAKSSIAYLNEQIEQTNVVELQRVLYNLLEAEQQTLMLANARQDYAFQVVDPAVVPVSIAKPKRLFLLILGAFAGGSIGVVLVFIRRVARALKEQEATAQVAN